MRIISLLVLLTVLAAGCGKPPAAPPPPAEALPEELPVLEQNEPPAPVEAWVTQPAPVFVDTADDIKKVSREEIEMNGPALD